MTILASLLLAASLIPPDKEIENFLKGMQSPDIEEAHAFIEEPAQTNDTQEKKCNCPSESSFLSNSPLYPVSNGRLLVFTSFSLPIESWKEHSHFLEKTGGCFVLRGLPSNSFDILSQKILELRKEGILANIFIDPEAFEKYRIDAIPCFVLEEEQHFDKLSGNLPLPIVLKAFSEKGQSSVSAKYLLSKIGETP